MATCRSRADDDARAERKLRARVHGRRPSRSPSGSPRVPVHVEIGETGDHVVERVCAGRSWNRRRRDLADAAYPWLIHRLTYHRPHQDHIHVRAIRSSYTTRMPYRMHSEYLRTLFLNNDLAEGRFKLNGRRIALQDIRLPVFVVGAEHDHVSPWRSVFKIHYLTGAEITFALANGGQNRGIVAPPGESGRYFRTSTTAAKDRRPDPHAWAGSAQRQDRT